MSSPHSVCIIGGGPQGLAALKNLLELNDTNEEGPLFKVDLLESRSHIGGIWTFNSDKSEITALRNTVQNTSRFRNCYSDFPVRDAWEFGGREDFPSAYLSQEDSAFYLEQYAKKFDLLKHVQFGIRALDLRRNERGTQWEVHIKDNNNDRTDLRLYDKVIVATGQHHDPMIPQIKGIHNFKGEAIHSASFKSNEAYRDQTVLVIGSSNSAGDVATELAGTAGKVLISRRRGVIIAPRISRGSYRPNDITLTRRFDAIMWTLTSFAPSFMAAFVANMMKNMIAKGWGNRLRPEFNLKSENAASITFQAPMVTDTIVPLLEAGKVKFLPAIQRITEDGLVELEDGDTIAVGAIIYCTGYSIDSCLAKPVERSGTLQLPRLYHNIYHPNYPDSLAYLTFWFTIAGIYEVGELAAMGIAQVFSARYKLPETRKLEAHIDGRHRYVEDLAARVPQPISMQSAARCVDRGLWMTFLHEAAGTDVLQKLGYGLAGWKFWLEDREFCHLLMTGVNSIHTSRLFDGRPGSRKKWDGARRAILEANDDLHQIEIQLREKDLAQKDLAG